MKKTLLQGFHDGASKNENTEVLEQLHTDEKSTLFTTKFNSTRFLHSTLFK